VFFFHPKVSFLLSRDEEGECEERKDERRSNKHTHTDANFRALREGKVSTRKKGWFSNPQLNILLNQETFSLVCANGGWGGIFIGIKCYGWAGGMKEGEAKIYLMKLLKHFLMFERGGSMERLSEGKERLKAILWLLSNRQKKLHC
jgi:hypothetical protein